VSLGRSDAGGSTIGAAEDELELDPDPFPEEEEQPFMDELSA
jgi:hypothetical protein